MTTTILVTGANGFVGKPLCVELINMGFIVRAISRGLNKSHQIASINSSTDWLDLIHGVDVVVHLAARLDVGKAVNPDALTIYRETNLDGTINLARQAVQAGVKRFIFISSVKVNGEQTPAGRAFSAADEPAPEDPYGISKWEAERALLGLAQGSGMDVVIIRPPLVYGPGVKGNFASMIKLVKSRLPLPLGRVDNLRSMVGIDNLISLIVRCISHPAAANQVFLVSDGHDLSTTDLLRSLALTSGHACRLIPLPVAWLFFGLRILGQQSIGRRLLGSLQVDTAKTRDLLDWSPPVSVNEGLRRCLLPETKS